MTKKLTSKEESFAQAYKEFKEDLISAYRNSLYSQNLTPEQMSVQANKLFNKPNINLRIVELTKKTAQIAEEKFTITVEKRLQWLNEIVEAGLEVLKMADGTYKRQNLPAARSAIDTLNSMLGTNDGSEKVKPVKIFVGVKDAS